MSDSMSPEVLLHPTHKIWLASLRGTKSDCALEEAIKDHSYFLFYSLDPKKRLLIVAYNFLVSPIFFFISEIINLFLSLIIQVDVRQQSWPRFRSHSLQYQQLLVSFLRSKRLKSRPDLSSASFLRFFFFFLLPHYFWNTYFLAAPWEPFKLFALL